jgi:hypothetical protein
MRSFPQTPISINSFLWSLRWAISSRRQFKEAAEMGMRRLWLGSQIPKLPIALIQSKLGDIRGACSQLNEIMAIGNERTLHLNKLGNWGRAQVVFGGNGTLPTCAVEAKTSRFQNLSQHPTGEHLSTSATSCEAMHGRMIDQMRRRTDTADNHV